MQSAINNPPSDTTHWPSVLQLALSLLAVLFLWTGAAGMALAGLLQFLSPEPAQPVTLPSFLMAGASLVGGLLLLPSAGYALLRLAGRQGAALQTGDRLRRPAWLVVILPLVLLAGYFVAASSTLSPLLLPPLHILAIGIPVLWLAAVSLRGLPLGSAQRAWGVFGSGLVLGPALILLTELLALVGFIIAGSLWFATQPELVQGITDLLPRLSGMQDSPDQILKLLEPYLLRAPVLFGAFTFISVVVPLIEESLKPIGLWLLVGRALSPVEGFAAGALSGAGYALFESLVLTTGGESWATVVIARIGTAVIHILTTAMTGYALALAWREGRYAYLGLAFLTSVTIHGLWNALAVATVVAALQGGEGMSPFPLVARVGSVAPLALVILTVLFFIVLIRSNRWLRRAADRV